MVALQVDHLAAGQHPYLDVGMAAMEVAQARDQPQAGKGGGGGQGQLLAIARWLQLAEAALQVGQPLMHLAIQALTGFAEHHPLGAALKQQQAKVRFQALDLVRDGCRGHRQFVAGSLEAAQTSRRFEGAQGRQGQFGEHGAQAN
ncbi:hypothetical protein D3C79_750330 [compost metagenome]